MTRSKVLIQIFSTLLLGSIPSLATQSVGYERFASPLETLTTLLKTVETPEEAARSLVSSERARLAAFELQALAKIYVRSDQDFDEIRVLAKTLEDGIGDVAKWSDTLETARENGASPQKLKALEAKVETALTTFRQTLETEDFLNLSKGPLGDAQKFLERFDWGSNKDDQRRVEKALRKQLASITETEYDLSRLEKNAPGEDGNGLHELRREIRWFALEARALGGALTFRPDVRDCPISAYRPLVTDPELLEASLKSKYASLPEAKPGLPSCEISRCLFYRVANVIAEFGDIKDAAERANLATDPSGSLDTIPPALQSRAEAISEDISTHHLLETLGDQIRDCR